MQLTIMFRRFALAIALCLLLTFMTASPVLAAPQLNLSPTSGARGTDVTVTGTNFASYAGDIVHILFGGVEIADSPLTVPQNGTFTVTFDVPRQAAPGIVYVTVITIGGVELASSNPFTIIGTDISISPEVGTVGTNVTVHGKGLYAKGKVTFYYYSNGARVNMGTDVTSSIGECTYSFTVPDSSSGSHRVVVRDANGDEAEARFDVISSIVLKPASAPIGAKLAVSGTGFGSESDVTIYLGDAEVIAQRTDEFGSFEVSFAVPELRPGIYNLEVRDKSGNMAQTQFTVVASISLSKVTGHIDEELTVSGTGFMGGPLVFISYDSIPVADCVADESGAFSVSFNIPVSIHGNHQVAASDGINLATSLFSVESQAPPVPEPVLPENGSEVEPETYFYWEDVSDPSGVTYTLQVATDADFSSVVFEETELRLSDYIILEQDKLQPTKKETPYYWRVKAVDGASNESEWSIAPSFYVSSSSGIPNWAIYILIAFGALLFAYISYRLGRRSAYRWDTS